LGASYLHGTSRALDPQLHRHVVLGNVVAGPDGSVRALDSASLYAHAKTAGYVAASELRWQLTDRDHAGAQGPMQFLPATWAAYGVDGDGDGVANIYDPVDAIWGAARMLCANGAGNPDTVRAAVFSYNHADSYVQQVMAVAATYEDADPSIATGAHALPVDRSWFVQHPTWLTLPHHDYPAIDIPVPVGTTAFAAVAGVVSLTGASVGSCGGTVLIDGDDGTRYTYCHLSAVAVTVGQRVAPGEPVAASGGAPGAPGAGDSTGPHLHFAIAVQGVAHCPQPALATWAQGSTYDPAAAPTSGCTTK
jgi:murein DD-endopeptidase MepM/ murein hydrolase activator NlpD